VDVVFPELTGRQATVAQRPGSAAGKQGGLRSALMTLLDSRGLDVDPATGRCIAECDSADTLSRWIARAAVAKTAAEATAD
jgi:hypothetical protein